MAIKKEEPKKEVKEEPVVEELELDEVPVLKSNVEVWEDFEKELKSRK